ncbi:MAG: sigma-70 family RNA polymerase sigma factor [Lachnospiraceae bacterium]|nr:sigma-70 family RNA polymerase sigma factor [Lachnospiraceae bacterium]
MENREKDNRKAIEAGTDPRRKEEFLREEQDHILRLAGKISHSSVTTSDDEWSVALLAVSAAIDSYSPEKGDFWPYAAVVMRNQLTDWYRQQKRSNAELPVSPHAFEGSIDDTEPDVLLQAEVSHGTAITEENKLREEILAIQDELKDYDISFFDLADCSPRSYKTRSCCSDLLQAMFLPPPLVALLRRKKQLPVKEMLERCKVSRKLVDRHRKYLIAASLILDGDYPGIAEYLKFVRLKKGES